MAGYAIYYGTASGAYSTRLDVGTNLTCTVTNLLEGITYYFAGTAYDDLGIESAYSSEISYSVPSGLPPTITAQPLSLTNLAGTTARFTVAVGGAAPLNYQWLKGGTPLGGATSATLTLVNVTDSNAGNYTVTISNAAGVVTSKTASLKVLDPPLITQQPASLTNVVGTTARFSVVASGTAPLRYQWFKAGTVIAGATASLLSLANVSSANAGGYTVSVTNIAGTVVSHAATLTVTAKKGHTALIVTLTATPDHWYELQATTNLVDWTTISQTTIFTNSSSVKFADPETGLEFRFYRWVEHPATAEH